MAWRRRGRTGLVAVLVAALVVACSGADDDTADADTDADSSAEADGTGAAPEVEEDAGPVERFEGPVEEFYVVPDPLPAGEPGALIRTMPVDAPEGEVGLRIMYHSTDAEGEDRAVTGVVHHPAGDAPDGGWPILAWAHGTSGLAPQCAPSRGPAPTPSFGVEGVRVATDYIGLGPEGELHPYLSAAAEAHAVIDGVAAVRSLPEVGAGDEWVVAGVSQGGHAALVTNERAAERLPDAELLGAVALAPGAELGASYGDDLQIKIITTMVLVGVAAEDPEVDVADYLSPEGAAAAAVIEEGCVGEIIAAMPSVAAAPDYFRVDPRMSPVGEAWLAENDPGQVASEAPLMLVQGGQDILVVPERTAALFERLCGVGQVVDLLEVSAADHDTVTDLAGADVAAWIAARFAGVPGVDDC